jgi:hypothetical protein
VFESTILNQIVENNPPNKFYEHFSKIREINIRIFKIIILIYKY